MTPYFQAIYGDEQCIGNYSAVHSRERLEKIRRGISYQ